MENTQTKIGQAVPFETVTKYVAIIEGGNMFDRLIATGDTYYAYPFDNEQDAIKKMHSLYRKIKKSVFSVTCDKRKRYKRFFYIWVMTFKMDLDPWYNEH